MSESERKTCGPMYLDALLEFCGDDIEKQKLFAAGFVHGQAEKVYLGACLAAMFRPSKETVNWLMEIVLSARTRYGLVVIWSRDEIWITRPGNEHQIDRHLAQLVENSPAWHDLRGALCGVPPSERDFKFHERQGYGEKCDGVSDQQKDSQ